MLWLAHPNALTVLEPETNRIRLIENDPQSALYNLEREPNGLCLHPDGHLLAATYSKGNGQSYLQKVEQQSTLVDVLPLEGTYAKRQVLALPNGHLLLSARENEIWELDSEGNQLQQFQLEDDDLKVSSGHRTENCGQLCSCFVLLGHLSAGLWPKDPSNTKKGAKLF